MTEPVNRAFNLLVICGPTASGKTRLGATIARHAGGEIISVDSRQVYRGMDIGTGKDRTEYVSTQGTVAVHLVDVADPEETYTLWNFQRDFYAAFEGIVARNVLPVAVGGSGLYLEAVLRRYAVPNVIENAGLRTMLMTEPREKLLGRLRELSPEIYDRTDISSKKRIVRAIEVATYGRDHDIRWGHEAAPDIRPLVIGVRRERAELRERIGIRLEQRLAQGLVDEVRLLLEKGISRGKIEQFGLEYRHVARFLCGDGDAASMQQRLFCDICRFAKRQETWFRGMERRGIPVRWVDDADEKKALAVVRECFGV